MTITIVTPPAAEPLTLTEAKAHLRVDDSSSDADITSMIAEARQYVEQYLQRALITQTLRLTLDEFPSGVIEVYPSLQSVTSIKYTDTNGILQTWDSANYVVDTYSMPGRIGLAYGVEYPSTRNKLNAIEIIFVAGYGNAEDIPGSIIRALKLLIGHWNENREAINIGNIVNELPLAFYDALARHRYLRF